MIYELRQYRIGHGRMEDNHDRMANHTPALLDRHGVRVAGRWEVVAGPDMPQFCYIMEWRDFAERETAWGSFYGDPEWPKVRAATNGGSEIVTESKLLFLRPNPVFRQAAGDPQARLDGFHQLMIQKTAIGLTGEVNDFLGGIYLPRLRAAGAHVIGLCDVVSGPEMPGLVSLLAWPSESAWRGGWRQFATDPAMLDAYAAQRNQHGRTLLDTGDTLLMEPASYNLPFASLRTKPR